MAPAAELLLAKKACAWPSSVSAGTGWLWSRLAEETASPAAVRPEASLPDAVMLCSACRARQRQCPVAQKHEVDEGGSALHDGVLCDGEVVQAHGLGLGK